MDKLFSNKILKNNKGQSVVEYILLLAVISGLGAALFNNNKLKAFFAGQDGLFSTMRKGMGYSYRYGREYRDIADLDAAMSFDAKTAKEHDTYWNKTQGGTHFFMGEKPYGE